MLGQLAVVAMLMGSDCGDTLGMEPRIRPLPAEYRVAPPEMTTDRRIVEGYVLETGVFLAAQKRLVCELKWGRYSPTGVLDLRQVGIVSVATDSGQAWLLDAPGLAKERDNWPLAAPFAYDDHSCGVTVLNRPGSEGRKSDKLWVWNLRENRVETVDKWSPMLDRLLSVLDRSRYSFSWSFPDSEARTGTVVIRSCATRRQISLNLGREGWYDCFGPADAEEAFLMFSQDDSGRYASVACVDFRCPGGRRWTYEQRETDPVTGDTRPDGIIVPVFNGRGPCFKVPIVVERPPRHKGEELRFELLCLDVKTGKATGRGAYKVMQSLAMPQLLVSADGKRAFCYSEHAEDKRLDDRSIEVLTTQYLDVVDLESGDCRRVFASSGSGMAFHTLIGFSADTSELLMMDELRVVAVTLSPDPTIRTIFELRPNDPGSGGRKKVGGAKGLGKAPIETGKE